MVESTVLPAASLMTTFSVQAFRSTLRRPDTGTLCPCTSSASRVMTMGWVVTLRNLPLMRLRQTCPVLM
ncbi:hypothetical protein D3C80_2168170 [compost metagenome]